MPNPMPFRSSWRREILALFLAALVSLWIAGLAQAQEPFPPARGAVNDFAGVIASADAARMEALCREVLEKTGASVVVATFPSLEGEELNDTVNRLYSFWGLGKKGKDRGVLIFLALKERKIRIETGYGVEGILPDGKVGEILDRQVLLYLKRGEYSRGLVEAVTAVSGVIAAEGGVALTGSPPRQTEGPPSRQRSNFGLSLILLVIFLSLLGTRRGREILPWIMLMLLRGSGRRGGGDFDGFGSFGGGFGGFGGGSSGGGGAGRHF